VRFERDDQLPERRRLWSLREDVLVEMTTEDHEVVVLGAWGETRLTNTGPTVRHLLQRMTMGPVSLENVLPGRDLAEAAEFDPELSKIDAVLDALSSYVVQSLAFEETGELLLSAVPLERNSRLDVVPVPVDVPVRLSRFAAIRSYDGGLFVESALSRYRVGVHWRPVGWIASSLGSPATIQELAGSLDVAEPIVADIVAFLVGARMLVQADRATSRPDAPRFAEDVDPRLTMWPYHELMFHFRSRNGREDTPYGVAARYRDRVPVLPVVKPAVAGRQLALPRRSARTADPGTAPELSLDVVGELLYRSASIRSVREISDGDVVTVVSDRPYPSSGGLYELELYLAVDRCAGLDHSVYHYDPLAHALTRLDTSQTAMDELLEDAQGAVGGPARPPLLIVITARVGRLSRQYCNTAYANTLRHVGLLQATVLTTAAAIGLTCHATAAGNGELTVDALNLNWPAEVNVGELMIDAG